MLMVQTQAADDRKVKPRTRKRLVRALHRTRCEIADWDQLNKDAEVWSWCGETE
jgi:hypothetical protein